MKSINKYAWADETSKVKIYVPLDQGGGAAPLVPLAEGGTEVTSTKDSVTLNVRTGTSGVYWQLQVAKLYDEIDGAKARVKSDKIILTLNKAPDKAFSWHDLKHKN